MNNSQCFRTIKLFDGFEVEFSARLRLVYNCWFVLFAKTSEGPDGLVWENQGPGSRDWKNSIVNIASRCQVNDTQAALAVPQTQAVIQYLAWPAA